MNKTMFLAAATALALSAGVANAEATNYVPMYVQHGVMTTEAATRAELGLPSGNWQSEQTPSGHVTVHVTSNRSTISEFPPSESNG
jgi:hypothetical protein